MTPSPSFEPIPDPSGEWRAPPQPSSRLFSALVAVFALIGATFSAVSTSDFMQFLDRQVHSIHCSFIPGAGVELGESGCKTVMMSPYNETLSRARAQVPRDPKPKPQRFLAGACLTMANAKM